VLRALAVPCAFVAAAVFAIHPVAVESVAWISETKTTLSFLLFGLALFAYLRFEDCGARRWYAAALALFGLALLAKTSVVMLPAVLLLLAWWRRGRIGGDDIVRSLPFFALSLALGLLTVHQQSLHSIAHLEVRPEGLASRLAATGWAFFFYLSKLLAPFSLSAIYPRWEVDPTWLQAWIPLLGVFVVATLAWRSRSGWGRPVLFAGGVYGLMLLPILGLVPFGFHRYSLVADHLQYPAMIAPIALVVAGVERAVNARRCPSWQQVLLVFALFVPLVVLARERVDVFRDHESLWTDTLEKNPQAWVAHYNLGVALDQAGDPREAAAYYQRALRLNPQYADAHFALGRVYKLGGQLDEAALFYRNALEIDPRMASAHNNLASILRTQGRIEEAIHHYRLALKYDPGLEVARSNLERMLEEQGVREPGTSEARIP
jgi:tetratricopeptide (TPR) repeat protein